MEIHSVKSVWQEIAKTPQEAEILSIRSNLMLEIVKMIRKKRWTKGNAAKKWGITQARLDDLLGGSIDKFSTEDLIDIFTNLGVKVQLSFEIN